MSKQMFRINWGEASTKRGAVSVSVFLVGTIMLLTGQSDAIEKLLLLGSGAAGILGVALPDKAE